MRRAVFQIDKKATFEKTQVLQQIRFQAALDAPISRFVRGGVHHFGIEATHVVQRDLLTFAVALGHHLPHQVPTDTIGICDLNLLATRSLRRVHLAQSTRSFLPLGRRNLQKPKTKIDSALFGGSWAV